MTGKQRNKKYNIKVTQTGLSHLEKVNLQLNKTNKSLKKVEKSSKSMAQSLGGLRTAFTGMIAVFSVREIARFSDEVQLLEDRLSVFANEGETGAQVLEQLNSVANETRASVTSLGEAYNRISINTKDLGLNTGQLLKVTQALQQTFRLSGASSAEATSSLIQLTQGIAEGELRGQELRSVLEANSIFGGLLAKEMGVARGALIKLGEQGALKTSVILKVLNENFDDLNSKAAQLRPTFEQGVLKGMNELRLAMNDLNREYNISGGFFNGITLVVNNLDTLAIALGAITATYGIPLLVTQLGKLRIALLAITTGNPLGVIVTGLTLIGVAANEMFKEMAKDDSAEELREKLFGLRKELKALEDFGKKTYKGKDVTDKFITEEQLEKKRKGIAKLTLQITAVEAELNGIAASGKNGKKSAFDEILPDTEDVYGLKELNFELKNNLITMQEYKNAQFDLTQDDLNTKFKEGKIDIDQYKTALDKAKEKMNSLKENQLDLSAAVADGAKSYIKSIGTLSDQIAGATKNAFSQMEDQLVDFVKTGKFRFADFTQSVLDDLLRIAVRQAVVAPIAGALFSPGASSSASTTGTTFAGNANPVATPGFAKGGAFSSGSVVPFATGGVVGSPTTFGMSGGRTGLMGEAGPEAIMPIERIGGKMGVNAKGMGSDVTVNIINNTDSGIETQEREGENGERVIEVLIDRKVKESFASGRMDKTMKTNFGVKRVGM